MEVLSGAPRSTIDEVRARRAEFEANRSRPWPDIIRDGHEICAEAAVTAEAADGELCGVAGSPGAVTGLARVIRGRRRLAICGRTTSWSRRSPARCGHPLFAVAGAVITSVGGILSHGAIVARE